MLNQLKLAKVFNHCNGIILGRFVDCYDPDPDLNKLMLNDVIVDYLQEIDKPVLYNFKHGHIPENITIPFGLKCVLNASRGFVELKESAVF